MKLVEISAKSPGELVDPLSKKPLQGRVKFSFEEGNQGHGNGISIPADATPAEVARILRKLADQIESVHGIAEAD